jgi:hypothetical protein
MTARQFVAIARHDLRASLMPLAGSTLALVGAMTINMQRNNEPMKLPIAVWLLFGLIMGAGLIARDRRLGLNTCHDTLPQHPSAVAAVRFAVRMITVLGFTALFLYLKWHFNYKIFSPEWLCYSNPNIYMPYKDAIWQHITLVFPNALLAALTGFSLSAAFSAVSRRESTAAGAAFLSLLIFAVSLSVMALLHPCKAILIRMSLRSPLHWSAIVITVAGFTALLRSMSFKEQDSKPAVSRVIPPLAAALVIVLVLTAAAVYQFALTPLEKADEIYLAGAITDKSDDMIVVAQKDGIPLSIWRFGPETSKRLTNNPLAFHMVASEHHLAMFVLSQAEFLPRTRNSSIEIHDNRGGLIRRIYNQFEFSSGQWSPDGRYYAHFTRTDNGIGLVFIPPHETERILETPLDVKNDSILMNRNNMPGIAGWTGNGFLICYNIFWQENDTDHTRIWKVFPGESPEMLWEGNLWPERTVHNYKRDLLKWNDYRNSVMLPVWQDDRFMPVLHELSVDNGHINPIHEVMLSMDSMDDWTRNIAWSDSEPLLAKTEASAMIMLNYPVPGFELARLNTSFTIPVLFVMDPETLEITKFRGVYMHRPVFSRDNRFAAGYEFTDGGRLVVMDTHTGKRKIIDVAPSNAQQRSNRELDVIRYIWTGAGNIAVMLRNKEEIGLVNPLTGQYEPLLQLKGDRQ